jgi:ActR/RegA family two-component response regulator
VAFSLLAIAKTSETLMFDQKLALIVEDEPILGASLEATLADMGFRNVQICTNVAAALRFLEHAAPAVAFVDWKIGQETADLLIERLEVMQVRTIVVTGYAESHAPFQRWPGMAIVEKPYSDETIRQVLGDEASPQPPA